MAAVIARDAAQQLYRAIYGKLTGDATLMQMIGGTAQDWRVYQSEIDYDAASVFKDHNWITFNIVNDRPSEAEQTQDIREIRLDIHCWRRGPGSSVLEDVEARVRELLDNATDLGDPNGTLLVMKMLAIGYHKTYQAQPGIWHITSSFETMCVALRQE